MNTSDLRYFDVVVDGKPYGGWFRVLSPQELEVLAVGLLTRAAFEGPDAEPTARAVLEAFIRRRAASGEPLPLPFDGTHRL